MSVIRLVSPDNKASSSRRMNSSSPSCFGIHGPEAALARIRSDPLRADGDHVLVQSRRVMAVKAEPPDQIDQRQRALRLGETGSRQVVVHEPLRQEPAQQSLTDPVLQVHVNRFDPGFPVPIGSRIPEIGDARIFKDDRSNRATGVP